MSYPTINFTGNKRKLVEWIYDNLPIKNGCILDIFSGGGSVSYYLKSTKQTSDYVGGVTYTRKGREYI